MGKKVEMIKNLIRNLLIVLSCLLYAPWDGSSSTVLETRHVSAISGQAQAFAPGQLEAHYAKHKYEFGNITIDQYLEQARNLLNAPADNDVLVKTRTNGDILHYRVSTGEFAVMTSRGRIRTYFKADMAYWMRQ
jgi:pyocin large subunit-like protein